MVRLSHIQLRMADTILEFVQGVCSYFKNRDFFFLSITYSIPSCHTLHLNFRFQIYPLEYIITTTLRGESLLISSYQIGN